jgi:hypothetical protein
MVAFLAALSAISTAAKVGGTLMSSKAEENAAKYNARLSEQNAVIAEQQAAAEVARYKRETYRRVGDIRAGYAASGVTMEGSPLDVLADSYAMATLDEENIKYQGRLEAMNYRNQASLDRAKAKNAKKAGYLSAAGQLLEGGTQTYGYYTTTRPATATETAPESNMKVNSSKSSKTTTTTTSKSSKK